MEFFASIRCRFFYQPATRLSRHHHHANPNRGLRQTLFGAYVQDDIRVLQNVTINLGLRYEMVTVPSEAHNRISVLRNLTDAQPHLGAPLFMNPTPRNFEPRVGVAWNPRGGRTLPRSGFGIFDALPLPYEFNLSFQRAVPLSRPGHG